MIRTTQLSNFGKNLDTASNIKANSMKRELIQVINHSMKNMPKEMQLPLT